MRADAPLVRLAVGVVVERRKAVSPWLDAVWRPVAVLHGEPEAVPWTPLAVGEDAATFYAGSAEIELYRTETEHYRNNLLGAACVWVALHATGGDPPYAVSTVTVDPAEGEALTEPDLRIVDVVPMPATLHAAVAAFVTAHHVERPFEKRVRDRADPEALARRGPLHGGHDER